MNGLSVIIPIYNVEKYIGDCLQSVVHSMDTLSNIQIILVDDGSKDHSGEIAQQYAEQYPNFHYVNKENGGLSDARNFGFQFVKYDYITFLDSDDYVADNYFSEIFQSLEKQPDMIIFDWMDVGNNHYTNLVKGMDFPDSLWSVQPSAWNKVYRTKWFDEVKFPKGKFYEDVGTIYKLLRNVKEYIYIDKPLYKYRKNRQGSILSTISPKINDIYDVLEDTYSFYKEKNELSNSNVDGLCYRYVKILMWSNMYRQLKYYKFNFVGFYKKMKKTRFLIDTHFPEWRNNEFLYKNDEYFKDRFGNEFVKRIDGIGKNFLETAAIITSLVLKNRNRY